MIVAILVSLGFIAVFVIAVRLNLAVDRASARFGVLSGGYRDARLLVDARRRFRRRQQSVENAVDTGTVGVQAAHRALAAWFGGNRDSGERMYAGVRAFNRSVGSTLSGVFAPGLKERSERRSDEDKRVHKSDDENA